MYGGLVPQHDRKMYCNACDTLVDRDANAGRNIFGRGLKTQARRKRIDDIKTAF